MKYSYIRAIMGVGPEFLADLLRRTGHSSTEGLTLEEARDYWDRLRTDRRTVEEELYGNGGSRK